MIARSRLVSTVLAVLLVTVAAIGYRLSDPDAENQLVRAPLDRPVAYQSGTVEVSDVRVATTLRQADDQLTTRGMFVVVHVAVRASGADTVLVSDTRLLTSSGTTYGYALTWSPVIKADPGFEAAQDYVFEVDPARIDDLTLELWLAVAVLMVLVYLSAQLTYARTHLPPPRYHRLAPGAVAHGTWADFRLVSLQQTDGWGKAADDRPAPPDAGAVWVVARLEVVPRERQQHMLCTLRLVATDGRSWEPELGTASHEGLGCVPDDAPPELGRTYPIVLGYQVPAAEAGHLAGLALEPYSWRRYLLLRPPA